MRAANYLHDSPEGALGEFRQAIASEEAELENEVPAIRGPCVGRGGKHWDVVNWNGRKIGSIVCCPCCENVPGGEPVPHNDYCGIGTLYASAGQE